MERDERTSSIGLAGIMAMEVTTDNQHVRLLSSEPFGWLAPPKSTRPTGADIVMQLLRSKSTLPPEERRAARQAQSSCGTTRNGERLRV